MKSVCFFCTYFNGHDFPYYIRVYLQELSRHFSKIIILTNKKKFFPESEQFINEINAIIQYYDNEGYDFGMWYKALNEINIDEFDRIGLVNDSCILFKELDETFKIIEEKQWDFCGLLSSKQVQWHLQSYFLIINKKALPHLKNYFDLHGLKSDMESVIISYEVGLSTYMMQKGMLTGSVYQSPVSSTRYNPSYIGVIDLIKNGFPMIKKKLIFGNYRNEELPGLLRLNFNFNPDYYTRAIEQAVPEPLIDFNHLKMDYYTAFHVIKRSILQFISQVIFFPLRFFRR